MMPRVIMDMLSPDAMNDGAERSHPLLKGVEVNTGQTEDYPLCLSFVKSAGIDGGLKPSFIVVSMMHCSYCEVRLIDL